MAVVEPPRRPVNPSPVLGVTEEDIEAAGAGDDRRSRGRGGRVGQHDIRGYRFNLLFIRFVSKGDVVPRVLFVLLFVLHFRLNRGYGRRDRETLRSRARSRADLALAKSRYYHGFRGGSVYDDLLCDLGHQLPPEVAKARVVEVPVLDDETGEVDPIGLGHLLEDVDCVGKDRKHPREFPSVAR